jgi:hypothetical protein
MNVNSTLSPFKGIFNDRRRLLRIEEYFCRLLMLENSVFRDITPCSPLKGNRRFAGTYCLHLQGRRTSQARNQLEACSKQISYLFFNPEDGGYMVLRNVGSFLTDYTAFVPEDGTLHYHLCENLTSCFLSFIIDNWYILFLSSILIVSKIRRRGLADARHSAVVRSSPDGLFSSAIYEHRLETADRCLVAG